MEIKQITNKEEWNTFVLSLKPNTFLQSWQWGQVQQHTGEGVDYLGVFDKGQQVAAAVTILVKAKRGAFYLIPHGPLVREGASKEEVLKALISHSKKERVTTGAVALRIAPLFETSPETTNVFQQLGFKPAPMHIHAELTWVLNITPSEEELLSGMRKTTRHAVRRAEKAGVHVEILPGNQGLERFWPLYETTKDRHGFVPFTRSFLEAQEKEFSPSDVYTVIATHEGKDVAGAILMHFGDTVFYHHGASIKLPSSVPAAQYLQWSAIKEAKRRGAIRYNFWGIAPEDEPNHPFAGITTFKKGFGGYAIDYMHAQDLPLSAGYALLWLVDTYRKKRRGF